MNTKAKSTIEQLEEIKMHYNGWICSTTGFVKDLETRQLTIEEKVRLEAYYAKNLADYKAKIEAVDVAIRALEGTMEMSHAEM